DPVVAGNDTATIAEDAAIPASGNLLANDTDADTTNPSPDVLSVTGFTIGSSPTVYAPVGAGGGAVTIPGVGLVSIATDGTWSFAPDADYNTDLSAGGSVFPTITYTVEDGAGSSDTATLIVTVTPTNDAPAATDDAVTTNEDSPVSGAVILNDID
ncbi:Ig-like domain-containing protein, partial [Ahrensia sp. R2A130]|uniref:Ig-like domain-containing protein n=2 Tax=Ahrensia sp. R2A130 TaxID=744979 RepID=UPI0001E0D8B6